MGNLGNFVEHQLTHLVETLSRQSHTVGQHNGVVAHSFGLNSCCQHFLLLIKVEVEEAGSTVAQKTTDEVQGVHLVGSRTFEAPAEHHVLGLLTQYILADRFGDGGLRCESQLVGVVGISFLGIPVAEVLFDEVHHGIGLKVTRKADDDIARNVPLVKVVLNVDERRVLEVLLGTDGSLSAVGVGGEEHSRQGFEFLRHIACHAHVLLLIDGFEFGVEETEHGVLETLRLDFCPVLHLVRWDVFGVACHVVRCKSIRSVGTNHGHHLVILVGDGIL